MQPCFAFGFKSDVQNNLHYYDDDKVIYPCGHNVVIYSIKDKKQTYIPGIQGSEGITALALSPSKKYLAVCEKASKAICTVYNIAQFISEKKQVYDINSKKKRVLISVDIQATEFISVSFSGLNEKQVATLTRGLQVILWQWDKQRALATGDCAMILP